MAKGRITIRMDNDLIKKVNDIAESTGRTKTDILSEAVIRLENGNKQNRQEIELLNKQNDQLKIMMSATQAVIDEKDKVIQGKDDLIAELRAKRKTFWQKLFGK